MCRCVTLTSGFAYLWLAFIFSSSSPVAISRVLEFGVYASSPYFFMASNTALLIFWGSRLSLPFYLVVLLSRDHVVR